MHQGRFFQVDQSTRTGEGLFVFRYMPVESKQNEAIRKFDSPKYPLYLILNEHAVEFYFHHGLSDERGKTKEHGNVKILELPLSDNLRVIDNLSTRLYDIYTETLQIDDWISLEDVSGGLTTYSSLGCLPSKTSKPGLDLHRLVLDFLFDMEHSRVFKASPLYDVVERKLHENFVLNAIASKASYYYERAMFLQTFDNTEVNKLYAQKLQSAEIQWLDVLQTPESDIWMKGTKWFFTAEEEYESVFLPTRRFTWKRVVIRDDFDRRRWESLLVSMKCDTDGAKIFRHSIRWFLRRYAMFTGLRIAVGSHHANKLLLSILVLIFCIGFPQFQISQERMGELTPIAELSYYIIGFVLFLIFSILIVFRKLFFAIAAFMLPRLLMAASSAWLLFITTEELWKTSFDMRLGDSNWIYWLLVPTILFMTIEIKNIAPSLKGYQILSRVFQISLLGFFYTLLIGVFLTSNTGEKMLSRSGTLDKFHSEKSNLRSPVFKPDPVVCCHGTQYQKLANWTYNWSGNTKQRLLERIIFTSPIGNKSYKLRILPGMIFYRTIFALFIGLFIQLIFEDKPITEPL